MLHEHAALKQATPSRTHLFSPPSVRAVAFLAIPARYTLNDSKPILMLGDCLERMKDISDASVEMVCTDLPYGTTQNAWDSIIPLDQLWAAWRRVCKPGAPIVLFTQQPFTTTVAASNLKELKTEWLWIKEQGTGFLNANRYPLKLHENILVFCDRKPPYFPQMTPGKKYSVGGGQSNTTNYGQFGAKRVNDGAMRFPTTVLHFGRDNTRLHPTAKPLALLEYLIRTYTHPGMTVLDCTMGSGSTGVAALNTGRQFIGIERDLAYFKIAEERIAAAVQPMLVR